MPLTNYAKNKLADIVANHVANPLSTDLYLKLHKGDPGADATSNAATETTRKIVSFAAASGPSALNDGTLLWTNVAATETYSHGSLWSASSGGNPWFYAPLASPENVSSGDTFQIPAGDVTVTFT